MGNIQPYYNGTGYGLNFIELLMIYNQMPASQKKAIYDGLEEESPLKKILRSIGFEFSRNTQHLTYDEKQLIHSLENSYNNDKIFKQLTQMSYPELIKFFIGTIRQSGNKQFERSKKEYIGLFKRILFNKSKQQENDENNDGRKKVSRRKAKKLKKARKKQKIENKTKRENAGLELRGIVNNTREEKETKGTKETLFKHFENKEISIEIENTFNALEKSINELPGKELNQRNLYINIINYTLENGSYNGNKAEEHEKINSEKNELLKKINFNIERFNELISYLQPEDSAKIELNKRLSDLLKERDKYIEMFKKNRDDFDKAMASSMQLIEFSKIIGNIKNKQEIFGYEIINLISRKKPIGTINDINVILYNFQKSLTERIEFFIKTIEEQKDKLDKSEIENLKKVKETIRESSHIVLETGKIKEYLITNIDVMPQLYSIYKKAVEQSRKTRYSPKELKLIGGIQVAKTEAEATFGRGA